MKVPRGDKILDWAINVLKLHADRKSILEVSILRTVNQYEVQFYFNKKGQSSQPTDGNCKKKILIIVIVHFVNR